MKVILVAVRRNVYSFETGRLLPVDYPPQMFATLTSVTVPYVKGLRV